MPISDTAFYKSRQQITLDMLADLQGAVADAYIGTDGIVYILFSIEAGQMENVLLANQILLQDCFPQTASAAALTLFGQMYGIPQKLGTWASGTVTFTGADGTYIPMGTEIGAQQAIGLDPLLYSTMADANIPNTGIPTAPITALNATAGNLTGSFEYAVTFITNVGETLQSADSNPTSATAQQINLTNIPIGGSGTVNRRIYRQKNGTGSYLLVTTIANNTATTFTDNVADASLGISAPTIDTAHSVAVDAIAVQAGEASNVSPGTITMLVNTPPGITSVINVSAFLNGSDPESVEAYRTRLMIEIADPQTGSVDDLIAWATSIEGVESASVFENDNMGQSANGHVTVRIAGPGGAIPDQTTIDSVQNLLDSWDIANITIHVSTFTARTQAVTVDVTPDATHTLAEVTPGVQDAIGDYIESIPVGGTIYLSGIVDAVYGLPGVLDVVVTTPATNQVASTVQKFVAGTITVT